MRVMSFVVLAAGVAVLSVGSGALASDEPDPAVPPAPAATTTLPPATELTTPTLDPAYVEAHDASLPIVVEQETPNPPCRELDPLYTADGLTYYLDANGALIGTDGTNVRSGDC